MNKKAKTIIGIIFLGLIIVSLFVVLVSPGGSSNNNISIITPTPSQIFTEDNPTTEFNITTAVEMDSCHWSEDSGITNYSMTQSSTYNWTLYNTTMVDGTHTITYSCNKSVQDSFSLNNFNNSLTSENLSFSGNENITRYLAIPKNANITRATINLSGNQKFQDVNRQNSLGHTRSLTITINRSRVGQRLNINGKSVQNLSVYISSKGSPDGQIYLGIRRTSDDGIIERILWGDASDLPTTSYINVTFISKPIINEEVRLTMEWENYTTSYILFMIGNSDNTDPLKNENLQYYNGTWYNTAGEESWDLSYKLSYTSPAFPINTSLRLSEENIWNHTGEFNSTFSPNQTDDFTSILNNALDDGLCTGGILNGDICSIPFKFHSEYAGELEYSAINIIYSRDTWVDSDSVSFDVDSVNVTVCRDLTVDNRDYLLQNNLSEGTNCLMITPTNISLDGQGYSIKNNPGGGIYLNGTNFSRFKNLKLENNSIYSIKLNNANNNNFTNITINHNTGYGVQSSLNDAIDNRYENLYIDSNNVINGFYYPSNSTFFNLTIVNGYDDALVNSKGSTYYNTTINGSDSGGDGLIYSLIDDNYFYTLDVTTSSGYSVGSTNGKNNYIRDGNLGTSASGGIMVEGTVTNFTLLNVTYNQSQESVSANSELTRKWYFQTEVNTSLGDLQDAQVDVWDKDLNLKVSELTNSTGNIVRQALIEYINTGGTIVYKNPYTINISKTDYITNSTQYNLTIAQNIFHIVTLVLSNTAPTIELSTPLNNTFSNSLLNDMTCNSTDNNGNLKNVTIFTWNNGVEESQNTKSINGSFNSTTWTNFGFTGENVYEWNCYTCDDADLCAWADSNYTLTLDTTNPNATQLYPNNTFNNTASQNLTVNLTDTRGILNVTLNIYNSTGDLINQTTYIFDEGITGKVLGIVYDFLDGVFSWFWRLFDRAGNTAATENRTITIDTNNPIMNITFPIDHASYNFNQSFNISHIVTDNLALDSCWYTNDSGVINYSIICGQNLTHSFPDGNFIYTFYSNDTVNNLGFDTVEFTISTLAPAITLEYPKENFFVNHNLIEFNFTALDTDGIDTCELWHNGTGSFILNQTLTSVNSGVLTNFTIVNLSTGASYLWNVWCNDSLGNGIFNTNNHSFTIDTTFPQLIDDGFSPTIVHNEDDVTINATITNSNLDTVWLEINFTGTFQNITITDKVIDQYFYTLLNTNTNNFQNISWRWYANDSAKNTNSTNLNSFTITNRNPFNITFITPNNTFVNTNSTIINFSGNDPDGDTLNFSLYNSTDGITFSLFGSTNVSFINFTNYNNNEGTRHFLYLTANDSQFQNSSITNITFTIDNVAPILNAITSPELSPVPLCSLTDVPFNYSVSDTNLDRCEFNVTLGGVISSPHRILPNCLNTTFNSSFDNSVQLLSFTAYDKANNSVNTIELIYFNTDSLDCGLPPSPPSGGGGGGGQIIKIPVIGINITGLSNLLKEVAFAEINRFLFEKETGQPLAIGIFEGDARITLDDLKIIMLSMGALGFQVTEEQMIELVEAYQDKNFFQGFEVEETIEKFNLFSSILGELEPFTIFPSSISRPIFSGFFKLGEAENITIPQKFTSNRAIKSCNILTISPNSGSNFNVSCEILSDNTFQTKFLIMDTEFFNKDFNAEISLVSLDDPEFTAIRQLNVAYNVYNFQREFLGIPMWVIFMGSIFIILFVIVAIILFRRITKN